jgi:hypothetical protein
MKKFVKVLFLLCTESCNSCEKQAREGEMLRVYITNETRDMQTEFPSGSLKESHSHVGEYHEDSLLNLSISRR